MSENQNEILVSKEYHIPMEMFRSAFKDFQKKFVYPKNIFMTIFLVFIAVSYTFSLIRDPGNSVCVLILILCAGLIFGMWINPVMIRKNLMKSVEGIQNDRYIAEFTDDCVYISTTDSFDTINDSKTEDITDDNEENSDENDFFKEPEESERNSIPKTKIYFNNDEIRTLEKTDYFIIYIVKKTFYVVPKSIYSNEELETIRKTLKKGKFYPLKTNDQI